MMHFIMTVGLAPGYDFHKDRGYILDEVDPLVLGWEAWKTAMMEAHNEVGIAPSAIITHGRAVYCRRQGLEPQHEEVLTLCGTFNPDRDGAPGQWHKAVRHAALVMKRLLKQERVYLTFHSAELTVLG